MYIFRCFKGELRFSVSRIKFWTTRSFTLLITPPPSKKKFQKKWYVLIRITGSHTCDRARDHQICETRRERALVLHGRSPECDQVVWSCLSAFLYFIIKRGGARTENKMIYAKSGWQNYIFFLVASGETLFVRDFPGAGMNFARNLDLIYTF